jgi:hypothetical protein
MEETEVIKNEGDSSRAAFSHEMKWDCRLLQSESESTLFFFTSSKSASKIRDELLSYFGIVIKEANNDTNIEICRKIPSRS